jgi:arabinogalactan oligomer/maltooligosaccharide transport system permease protein
MIKWLRNNLWRHAVGISMVLFAVFPLYLVILSSFNPTGGLQLTSFLPTEISLVNYQMLFESPAIPF